jgi:riboflavin synthase
MFTGIVQALGSLAAVADTGAGKRLTVALAELADAPIQPGDSVCVCGVCLTVTEIGGGKAAFDVVGETLRRTTLGGKSTGAQVNLELSLRGDSFVGGHFVQGHVDALGKVAAIKKDAGDWRITIEVPADAIAAIIPKGSVAIDGVSMTVAEVSGNSFTVAVIPTTLKLTTLGALAAGDGVNIETDILARTVVHYLKNIGKSANGSAGVTMEKLRERGFA